MRFYHLWTTKLQNLWFCCLRTMKLRVGGCGFVVLWGGEMNSEAVSVGDTASLLGCTCRWVAPMGCPALFGRWAVRGVQRINAGGTETKT